MENYDEHKPGEVKNNWGSDSDTQDLGAASSPVPHHQNTVLEAHRYLIVGHESTRPRHVNLSGAGTSIGFMALLTSQGTKVRRSSAISAACSREIVGVTTLTSPYVSIAMIGDVSRGLPERTLCLHRE